MPILLEQLCPVVVPSLSCCCCCFCCVCIACRVPQQKQVHADAVRRLLAGRPGVGAQGPPGAAGHKRDPSQLPGRQVGSSWASH